jgi:hypothetical protein
LQSALSEREGYSTAYTFESLHKFFFNYTQPYLNYITWHTLSEAPNRSFEVFHFLLMDRNDVFKPFVGLATWKFRKTRFSYSSERIECNEKSCRALGGLSSLFFAAQPSVCIKVLAIVSTKKECELVSA